MILNILSCEKELYSIYNKVPYEKQIHKYFNIALQNKIFLKHIQKYTELKSEKVSDYVLVFQVNYAKLKEIVQNNIKKDVAENFEDDEKVEDILIIGRKLNKIIEMFSILNEHEDWHYANGSDSKEFIYVKSIEFINNINLLSLIE